MRSIANYLIAIQSPLLIAVALWGISGIYKDFQVYISPWNIGIFFFGILGIVYISLVSDEAAFLTAAKLSILTAQWLSFLFGLTLSIYALTNDGWYFYIGTAGTCGILFWCLLKLQVHLARKAA